MIAQRIELHRVSRMYFVADRKVNKRLKEETCHRITFKYHLPENVLTKEMEICDIEDEKSETKVED